MATYRKNGLQENTNLLSQQKISDEKGRIQIAAKAGELKGEVCGHCGRKIVGFPSTPGRWYHYSYSQLRFLSKSEMYRHCQTGVGRSYQSQSEKRAEREKLPKGAVATPKAILAVEYKERAKTAKKRLKEISRELANLL